MKRTDIMKEIKKHLDSKLFSKEIIDCLDNFLLDYPEYEIEIVGNNCYIESVINEGDNGNYFRIVIKYDEESKTNSIVTEEKEYAPFYETRYGIRDQVSLNMFSTVNSYVFDENGTMLYNSWYSDENRYFGSDNMPIPVDKDSLKEYFKQTSPKYKDGKYFTGPESAYRPFNNIWERYGKTSVYHQHGRNPIKGEYSMIGVYGLDMDGVREHELLQESYGTIYSRNGDVEIEDIDTLIIKLDELFNKHKKDDGVLDYESFMDDFTKEIIKPRRY